MSIHQRAVLAALSALVLGAATPALARHARPAPAPDPIGALADAATDVAPDADAASTPSNTVGALSAWAASSGDNQGKPFIVIDKPTAEVFVYDGSGGLVGAAPALLGSALGDTASPGVGDEELSEIPMDQRTTEAGRFIAHIGPAKGMSSVLWVDFNTALSMHPVITSNPKEQRLQRLSSPSPEDRRITHGCINVPAKFYRDVVRKTFGDTEGVVYILPDTEPVDQVFPQFALQTETAPPAKGRHKPKAQDDQAEKTLASFGARF